MESVNSTVNKTVNNAMYSASHAIWGETHPEHMQHGNEPRSGIQVDPGTPSQPGVITTPQPYDAPELTAAVNSENEESQLGAASAATRTSPSGFNLSRRMPLGPEVEKAPVGMDPVSTDASALSSTLNQSNVTGIPNGPVMARSNMTDSGRLGRSMGTGMGNGPRVGALNQTSLNPAMIGAGLGGGSAVDMSKADMDETDDFGLASSNKSIKGLDLGSGSSGRVSTGADRASAGAGVGAGAGSDVGPGVGPFGDRSTTTSTGKMAGGGNVYGEKANSGYTGYGGGYDGGYDSGYGGDYANSYGGKKESGASPTDKISDDAVDKQPKATTTTTTSRNATTDGSGEKTMASPTDTTADTSKKSTTGGAEGAEGAEGNEASGQGQEEPKIKPKSNVSKEALRGPSVSEPRQQYELEKNNEIRKSISNLPSGKGSKAKEAKEGAQHSSHNQKTSTLSKVKDKIESHIHHTSKT